jgi:hypothetical protein
MWLSPHPLLRRDPQRTVVCTSCPFLHSKCLEEYLTHDRCPRNTN